MLPRRPVPRPRTALVGVLAAATLAVGLGAGPAAPPARAGETVCKDVYPNGVTRRDVWSGGRLLGRVWIHLRRDGGSCVVLQAVEHRGTPHYMSLKVCQVGSRPYGNCTGTDAGKYRYYAGPITFPISACQAIRVKIDRPGGRRLTDRWVYGACN